MRIYEFVQKLIKRFCDGRSQVKITGLRSYEKLYEELLTSEDNTIPTDYKKKYLVKVNRTIDVTIMEEVLNFGAEKNLEEVC